MALAKNKRLLLLAVGGLMAACIGGFFLLKGVPVRPWIDALLAWLRGLGPAAFFVCMALLPVLGFPMIFFSLSAGPIFGEQLGLPLVILLVSAATAANISITYWLARYGIRPTLEKLVRRMGYTPPKVEPEDELGLAVLVRVTPGPPFFVQSYLLGLAEVRFSTYFFVSWTIAMSFAVGLLFFGDAILHGKAKGIIVGVSVLIAAMIVIRLLRRHLAQRRPRQHPGAS
ncbi:MAG: VTT domain-containing protein [Opitutaceae bacterium]|nr:VTT domain-containing protein [Opitutaceae bacterium]